MTMSVMGSRRFLPPLPLKVLSEEFQFLKLSSQAARLTKKLNELLAFPNFSSSKLDVILSKPEMRRQPLFRVIPGLGLG